MLDGTMTVAKDAEMMINARIAQIDHLVSLQLNEIMHNAAFRSWKATWRGLEVPDGPERDRRHAEDQDFELHQEGSAARTCSARRNSTRARCSRKSTRKSMASSAARRSAALVGDYEFGKHPEDMELLEKISHVAAAAHAPFIAAAAPDMFNLRELYPTGRAARPCENLRHHRIREVEELPPIRRFPLCGALPARVL